MNQPFLVTGCGRSGTGWAASFFTEVGYPCGHEVLYHHSKHGPLTANESSWLAVPFLEQIPEETPIVRVIRNPVDVVASVMARGFLKNLDGPYEQFVVKHRPDVIDPDDYMGRAIRWACLWDEDLDIYGREYFAFHIDNYGHQDILNMLDHLEYTDTNAVNIPSMNKRVNAGPPKEDLRSQIMMHPEGWMVQERAAEWGYDV